ncbi:hypothetical protein AgCh_021665 [Apium graveolens]
MCMSKNNGGLGFRDIHGFNLALLGKQCWNMVNRPYALVSRVLKARYYPTCHFLQAGRIGGASYTWSGIWQAKEDIKKDLRWVLGDGKSIQIAKDRWLRAKEDFCVDGTMLNNQTEQLKVCDFFRENEKTWDEHKIRINFSSDDADAILNTRIPQGYTRDGIFWVHSSNGKYKVRSGYFQWCKNHSADSGI